MFLFMPLEEAEKNGGERRRGRILRKFSKMRKGVGDLVGGMIVLPLKMVANHVMRMPCEI